jgi:hypothetical protein
MPPTSSKPSSKKPLPARRWISQPTLKSEIKNRIERVETQPSSNRHHPVDLKNRDYATFTFLEPILEIHAMQSILYLQKIRV